MSDHIGRRSCAELWTMSTYPRVGVTLMGRVSAYRPQAKLIFFTITDGSDPRSVACVLPRALGLDQDLGLGASVKIEGELIATPARPQPFEVMVQDLTVYGIIDEPDTYPIQPKPLTPEFLRTVPHLRARTAMGGAVARVRSRLMQAIHEHLQGQGCHWVPTPILTHTDCEGAGQTFVVKSADPRPGDPDWRLSVSGQLDLESAAMALGRVYAFGPTFRAERSRTRRHLSEFWMVEPEYCFIDFAQLQDHAETFLRETAQRLIETSAGDLEVIGSHTGRTPAWVQERLAEPFVRMSYTEAVERCQRQHDITPFAIRPEWGMDLGSEHEQWIVSAMGDRPVILTHYPKEIKPFYMMPDPEDQRVVQAMDVLLPGLGEVIGGSMRHWEYEPLRGRMMDLGMDIESYQAYLDLRRYGSMPHGGFGLGFERWLMWLTGAGSVFDVAAFPRSL